MVFALIGIITGFAVTRMSYWGYRMDANIRLMQNAIIGAQQTAITKNVAVQVMFDANNNRLRILQDVDDDGEMDLNETVRYRPLAEGVQFQAPPSTIDGAAAVYMTGPGAVSNVNPLQLSIRIAPNGSLSGDVVIYVGSPRRLPEDFRAMAIVGATARTAFWSRGSGAWVRRDN